MGCENQAISEFREDRHMALNKLNNIYKGLHLAGVAEGVLVLKFIDGLVENIFSRRWINCSKESLVGLICADRQIQQHLDDKDDYELKKNEIYNIVYRCIIARVAVDNVLGSQEVNSSQIHKVKSPNEIKQNLIYEMRNRIGESIHESTYYPKGFEEMSELELNQQLVVELLKLCNSKCTSEEIDDLIRARHQALLNAIDISLNRLEKKLESKLAYRWWTGIIRSLLNPVLLPILWSCPMGQNKM